MNNFWLNIWCCEKDAVMTHGFIICSVRLVCWFLFSLHLASSWTHWKSSDFTRPEKQWRRTLSWCFPNVDRCWLCEITKRSCLCTNRFYERESKTCSVIHFAETVSCTLLLCYTWHSLKSLCVFKSTYQQLFNSWHLSFSLHARCVGCFLPAVLYAYTGKKTWLK